jgi:hypothetical protein
VAGLANILLVVLFSAFSMAGFLFFEVLSLVNFLTPNWLFVIDAVVWI